MASAVTILTLTLHTAIDRVIEAPDFTPRAKASTSAGRSR